MAKPKDVEIKARVTAEMKQRMEAIADDRGESISVVVREALSAYLGRQSETPGEVTNRASKGSKKEKRAQLRDIYDVSIYCGIPAGWAEDRQIVKPSRTIKVPRATYQPGMFGLDVQGESMNAAKGKHGPVLPGETVLLVPFTTSEDAANQIVAANIDGKTTLKRMVCPKTKPCYLRAESTSPDVPSVMHPLDEITVLGVVVGKLPP